PEELAASRGLQLLSERPYPWSRELWVLLLDRLFAAGARGVVFDFLFYSPHDDDPAFFAPRDRYPDKSVVSAHFVFPDRTGQQGTERLNVQFITPNDPLIPPPQFEDNRVGFVNFWPDPIDGKPRAATYRVTNRQLYGSPPQPGDQIYESFATRALA